MGQGGFINLVNGTDRRWIKQSSDSYQMNAWNFPQVIDPGTSPSVYVEWDENIFHTRSDDVGQVTYVLEGTNRAVQVYASAKNGLSLTINSTVPTAATPDRSSINLGWHHDGSVSFVLAGSEGHYTSSINLGAWMQDNIGFIGDMVLSKLCMPGSHDAGMSFLGTSNGLASTCNTVTQSYAIAQQLNYGIRYFDIRPVISAGIFKTGHYDYPGSNWGGNGQFLQSIMDDVNAFTATHNELVILKVSHTLFTDSGYRDFTQGEWNSLFDTLVSGLRNIYSSGVQENRNLVTEIPLRSFICPEGRPQASVLIVVDCPDTVSINQSYENKGIFRLKAFKLTDNYSNTSDLEGMINDQINKMNNRQADACHLLSWTLTQSSHQMTTCCLDTEDKISIRGLARGSNERLFDRLLGACNPAHFPNIIYIDNVQSCAITALAMAVNTKTMGPHPSVGVPRYEVQEEKIRTLAYDLWEKRGAPFNNCPEQDWFESEKAFSQVG